MKVSITEKGGWGANLNRAPTVLDAETLPQAEREALDRLVRAAFDHPRPERSADRKVPGSFTISVEDQGGRRTLDVADIDEENEPAASALRGWIMTRARRGRP